jgi:hypothetical protein
LEIPGGKGIGVQADQSTAACNNDTSWCTYQEWMASYQGAGQWAFINVNNQNALEVNGAVKTQGASVDTWGFTGATNELWTLQSSGAGTWKLVNVNSQMFVDVTGASDANGALVEQWPNSGGTNQEWTFVPMN